MGRGRWERLRWAGGGEGGEELARARSGKEKGGGRVDKKHVLIEVKVFFFIFFFRCKCR